MCSLVRQAGRKTVEGSEDVRQLKRTKTFVTTAALPQEGVKRLFSPSGVSLPKRAKVVVAAAAPIQELDAPKVFNTASARLSPEFGKQMKQAEIPRLDRRLIQMPRVHSSYNDDVKMDAFFPSDMTYADKQRRGIHENFESCTSMREHGHRALNGRFPLAAPIPPPAHIKKAAAFTLAGAKHLYF